MRSWTPRHPAPALEQRIFGTTHNRQPNREEPARHVPGWGWLAPVACVLVLALQLVVPGGSKPLVGSDRASSVLAFLSPSNQTLTAFAPGWANSTMNNINGETFESTNWTTAPSPMRTLPVFLTLTNGLIQ